MRALRPWIGIALLAPMLVLAVSPSSFMGVRCRMSGMVSLATCCPDGEPGQQAPAEGSVGEPGCCERVVVETVKPIADVVRDGDSALVAPMPVLAQIPIASAVVLPRVAHVVGEGGPPIASRLSLRLLNRSLLI
jgi:hypothetical protein